MREWEPSKEQSACFELGIEVVYKIIFKERNGNAIDIGSAVGRHSKVLQDLADEVYAFDPIDHDIAYKENVKFYNALLDKDSAIKKFYLDPTSLGKSSLYNSYKKNISVPIKTSILDEHGLNDIRFIKMDAEGNEYNILLGGLKTILKSKPVIYIEGSKKYLTQDIVDLLKELNYTLYSLSNGIKRYELNSKLLRDNVLVHNDDKIIDEITSVYRNYILDNMDFYTRWFG